MIRGLDLFRGIANRHWTVRALALSTLIAGGGFVIGRGGTLLVHGWSGSASSAHARPAGLLTDAQSASCLSWARRIAASTDTVLGDEALRFLTVAAIFGQDAAIAKGVDRLRALAQRRLDAGEPELSRRIEGLLAGGIGTPPADANLDTPPQPLRMGSVLTQVDLKLIHACRLMAKRPVEELASNAGAFLWAFAVIKPDATLRYGLTQLCEYAIRHRTEEKGYETADSILESFEAIGPPSGFEHYQPELQDIVWRWRTTKKR